jgi:S1-C subfamily serine protease
MTGCFSSSRSSIFTPAYQAAVTVRLDEICVKVDLTTTNQAYTGYRGTGIALGPRRVLTAGHMADCNVQGLYVELPNGSHAFASVIWLSRARDLALLSIPNGSLGDTLASPEVAAVKIGETVCAHVADPKVDTLCGVVTSVGGPGGRDVNFTGAVQHGNSGAGVFNAQGKLVGIITAIGSKGDGVFTSVQPEDIQ